MITKTNIQIIVIAILALAALWIFDDWKFNKRENERNTENVRQQNYFDSIKNAVYIYNQRQMDEYIQSNSKIKEQLRQEKIKSSRVTSIQTRDYIYSNKKKNSIAIVTPAEITIKTDSIVSKGIPIVVPFTDSTSCLKIKGNIKFENSRIFVEINEREFKNKTTVIGYWERRQWKFLGIKTRFLGKVQATAKIIDECGHSEIITINKKE